jgi:hypothetical protein
LLKEASAFSGFTLHGVHGSTVLVQNRCLKQVLVRKNKDKERNRKWGTAGEGSGGKEKKKEAMRKFAPKAKPSRKRP